MASAQAVEREGTPAAPLRAFRARFLLPPAKLAIEVEGIVHEMGNRPERDEARFEWLESRGVGVLRIPATDVLKDADAVAESIVSACRERGA